MHIDHHDERKVRRHIENESHEGKKKYRRRSSDKYWIAPLTAFLGVAIIIIIVLIYYLKNEREINDTNLFRIADLNQKLIRSDLELEGLRHKLSDTISNNTATCIPNLSAIKFDQTMVIDKDYVTAFSYLKSY